MRVVSLVPSWTEALFAIGCDERELVGITKWCVRPAGLVDRVERVGGTKDPSVPRIVELAPDVVIANREENRREDVEALVAAGVRVLVTDVRTARDAGRETVAIGRAVGRAGPALDLAARIDSTVERVGNASRGREPVPVFCPIWRREWMSINGDTFAHDVLRLAGARNVCADLADRYPLVSPQEALARGAEVALLPSEPYPFQEKHVEELVAAGFARSRVALVDGEWLTWYGPRMLEGLPGVAREVAALRAALSPE